MVFFKWIIYPKGCCSFTVFYSFEKGSILTLNEVNFNKFLNYKKDASEPKKALMSEIKLSSDFNIYKLSQNEYDPLIIGIAQNSDESSNPDISIITKGIGYVKSNNENGIISKGDLVTSSNKPGEAMKATKSGVILGIALEDGKESSDLLKIRVMIQYVHLK